MDGAPTSSNGARFAYEAIRQAIVEGRYRPGQRLVEQRLAETHGLSRTPVREALKWLDGEGLVQIEPNRGAIVRRITLQDVHDLYELRAELEGYAARRAAMRIEVDGLTEIDAGIAAFDDAVPAAAAGDIDGVRAVNAGNRRIHGAIVEAAQHNRLAQLLHRTVDVPLVFQAFRRFDRAELERSNQFHRLMRGALAARDAPRAEALMIEHIAQGRDVLLEGMVDVEGVEDVAAALGWSS